MTWRNYFYIVSRGWIISKLLDYMDYMSWILQLRNNFFTQRKIRNEKKKNSLFTKGRLWLRKKILNGFPHTYSIQLLDDGESIGTNQFLFLPKVNLKIKNSTKKQLWFRPAKCVVFNSIQFEKKVSTNAEKRVARILRILTTCEQPKFPHNITKYIGVPIFVFADKTLADVTDVNALG